MNNIKFGTIVRTILFVIAIINLILKAQGKSIIDIEENIVAYWLETIVDIAIMIVSFWKNNSFSKYAIMADEFLQHLKETNEQ